MIELRNIQKVYQSKKGPSTIALQEINLKFSNCGLVFIIGKSGSGKSTLLNLLGGLDTATSGEIFIHGKELKQIKKEMDSYRNSFIGFIFQDFHLLEEYNVYENIALAKELQNQKIKEGEIEKLLVELDLEGLSRRKINELSGGQKQRIAIARALIKNPTVLLLDEPTGNLDRKSSDQIFQILKEISKTKLVIVVSHDMESAEQYGDRIIRIEDGMIVSDTNKDVIDDLDTLELKKSNLPFKYALSMALTSLKSKPGKLLMTILLTTIAFIFMAFTLNFALFDKVRLVTDTMEKNNDYFYKVNYTNYHGPYYAEKSLPLTKESINYLENLTGKKVNLEYQFQSNENKSSPYQFSFGTREEKVSSNDYFPIEPTNFTFVEVKDENVLQNLVGKAPQNAHEIVVHRYFIDYMMHYGIKTSDGQMYYPKSLESVLDDNKTFLLGNDLVKIVGFIKDDNQLYQKAYQQGYFTDKKMQDHFLTFYMNQSIYVKNFTANKTNLQFSNFLIYDDNIPNLTKTLKTLKYHPILDELDNGNYYFYYTHFGGSLNTIIGYYQSLRILILIVSLVFVLFAFLLFSNFIGVSISYCKKEIGILRALGARKKDIIKIFGYEALIVGFFSWIFSMIGWVSLCIILNHHFFGNLYYQVNGFLINPWVFVLTLLFTGIIAMLITISSISKISKINPIDVILNK